MLDEQHGRSGALEVAHEFEDALDDLWRKTRRGLVEHQQARPRDQSAGDGQHLLLAAGKGKGLLTAALGKHREARVRVRNSLL